MDLFGEAVDHGEDRGVAGRRRRKRECAVLGFFCWEQTEKAAMNSWTSLLIEGHQKLTQQAQTAGRARVTE